MEIIILGSSGAIPVKERNLPSIALKSKTHPEIILFDCGEDTQRQFIEAGLKLNKPLKIFISHFHGDHIIGLPGLLFRFSLIDRTAPLMIFGHRNLFLYLYFHRKTLGLHAKYPITIVEIDNESQELLYFEGLESEQPVKKEKITDSVIFETQWYAMKHASVEHSVLTYAYAFVEKPRFGKFNPERAIELEIPQGRIWKKLHEGNEIEYEGKLIDPVKEGIVGPKRPGRKITYSGDTMPCQSLIELGNNSDLLIHESTYAKKLADVAIEKKHSTSIDAANSAKNMNAKQLLLTHISSRYQDDANLLLDEAKEIFPNTILARDLLRITID